VRQADSTIKGYLYQFNKSILEIMKLDDDDEVVLEGTIEDIDILSPTSTTTIQCKYHEDKKFLMSSVAEPILEMLCNYCEAVYIGKNTKYILYAFFNDNVDHIEMTDFLNFLSKTQDKEILIKYFHRIFTVPEAQILNIANKSKKTSSDKETLISYYKANRARLSMRVDIHNFWNCFHYIKAERFDQLKETVIAELSKLTDPDTAASMYYPNAFSFVALLSAKHQIKERTVTKKRLLSFLADRKSVLLNKWTLEATDQRKLLKAKKSYLSTLLASNPDVRAFVFSDAFLSNNTETIIPFIREYLGRYYKKPKLQKPPLFVFGDNSERIMQDVVMSLYKYQQQVHTGFVGTQFLADSFIHNPNCPKEFVCKITQLKNVSSSIFEQCQVNQLYIVGAIDDDLSSQNYLKETLDIPTTKELMYIFDLTKTLEG